MLASFASLPCRVVPLLAVCLLLLARADVCASERFSHFHLHFWTATLDYSVELSADLTCTRDHAADSLLPDSPQYSVHSVRGNRTLLLRDGEASTVALVDAVIAGDEPAHDNKLYYPPNDGNFLARGIGFALEQAQTIVPGSAAAKEFRLFSNALGLCVDFGCNLRYQEMAGETVGPNSHLDISQLADVTPL